MGQPKLKERPVELHKEIEDAKEQQEDHNKENLSGSLAAVTVLGLFIIISWLGVWSLFMYR